jgi:hypothetical protein
MLKTMRSLCFLKVKKDFIVSLHLISKESDLYYELSLPSSGTFWGLSIFGLSV